MTLRQKQKRIILKVLEKHLKIVQVKVSLKMFEFENQTATK
jgi:hypothetical protein